MSNSGQKPTIGALLASLRERNIKITAEGGKLKLRAPKGAMTPELASQLKSRKEEIIHFLSGMQTNPENRIHPMQRKGSLPLSLPQRRMWLVQQLDPKSSAFNIPGLFHIKGLVNVEQLQQTINTIAQRHEILRTTYPTEDGKPIQRIAPKANFTIDTHDFQNEKDPQASALEAAEITIAEPFILSKSCMHISLMHIAPKEHFLCIVLHHIAADGWSAGVFLRELTTLYMDNACQLPELPVQYADYTLWQRNWLQSPSGQQQLTYWRHQLKDAPIPPSLSQIRARPDKVGPNGARVAFQLCPSLSETLDNLGRTQECTPFMTLYAIFALLLASQTQSRDVLLGTSIANRNRSETENLIGFFLNALVLRLKVEEESQPLTFIQLLRKARTTALAAFAHQDLPFEQLIEHNTTKRQDGGNPYFRSLFVLQNTPEVTYTIPNQVWTQRHSNQIQAKLDLNLTMFRQDGYKGYFEYATDVFPEEEVNQLCDRFTTLIGLITLDPDQPLSALLKQANAPQLPSTETVTPSQKSLIAGTRLPPDTPVYLESPIEGNIHQLECQLNVNHESLIPSFLVLLARLSGETRLSVGYTQKTASLLTLDLNLNQNIEQIQSNFSAAKTQTRHISGPTSIHLYEPGIKINKDLPVGQHLSVFLTQTDPQSYSLTFISDPRSYRANRMEMILQQWQHLHKAMSQQPTIPIGKIALFNSSNALLPDPSLPIEQKLQQPVTNTFLRQLKTSPENIAISSSTTSLSYADLAKKAAAVAEELKQRGLKAGEPVALWADGNPEMIAGMIGLMMAGGVLLNISPTLPSARIKKMLLTGCRFMVAAEQPSENDLDQVNPKVLTPSTLPNVFSNQLEPCPSQPAYIFFTSGTTGTPRALQGTHQGLSQFIYWQQATYNISDKDRVAQLINPNFDAILRDVFLPLCCGATLCLPDPEDKLSGSQLLPWLAQEKISLVHTVPSIVTYWLDTAAKKIELTHLRHIFFSGEPLSAELIQRWRDHCGDHTNLVNFYGPSETTMIKTAYTVQKQQEPGIQPIGKAMTECQALIFNELGTPCAPGEVGEIVLRTPNRTLGYLNDPQQSQASFRPNPFRNDPQDLLYYTGDRGRYRADGNLIILGRKDDQIKIRGVRVEPMEIASVLQAHPTLKAVFVLARPNKAGEMRLVAWYTSTPGAPTPVQLRDYLANRLPDAMVPAALVPVEKMPLLPTGKIDRNALPDPEPGSLMADYAAPVTPLEQSVAAIWCQLLNREKVGRLDHFFHLGGHSLLAIQVVSQVRTHLNCNVSLPDLFDNPTLTNFCAQLKPGGHAAPPIEPLPPGNARPLSFGQQRLWFLDKLAVGSGHYNIHGGVRLIGRLNQQALTAAAQTMLQRHQILRTTFHADSKGQALQVVHDQGILQFDIEACSESGLNAASTTEANYRFDLTTLPMVRLKLLQLGPENHVMLLTMHHIISDGWSIGVMIQELGALYDAYTKGHENPLPPLPITYADYAHWQREWLQGAELERQTQYWKKQLAGLPPLLELPTDRPRPAEQTHHGAIAASEIDATTYRDFTRTCRKHGVTLFMGLQAAYAVLLARLSGQHQIPIGIPVAGRKRRELEPLVGFFVNTLVLRNDLQGNPDFPELLARVRQTATTAYAHDDLPFEQVVDAIQPERNFSHGPLFQVMFSHETLPFETLELSQLKLTPFIPYQGTAKCDLTLTTRETQQGLACAFEYNTDLFDAQTVRRYAGYFQRILQQVNSTSSINLYQLIDAEENQRLLETFTGKPSQVPSHNVLDQLDQQAHIRPDAVAIVCEDETLTYRQLATQIDALTAHFQNHGLQPEYTLAIFCDRTPQLILGIFAALRCGANYLPLDPAQPDQRLQFYLTDAHCQMVYGHTHHLSRLNQDLTLITAETLPEVSSFSPPQIYPEMAAYRIYTSGSTGTPKGVVISHGSLTSFASATATAYEIQPGERMLQFASPGFDISVEEIFCTLTHGATLVLRNDDMIRSTQAFVETSIKWNLHIWNLPTAYWHQLAVDIQSPEYLPPNLRLIIIGGERVRPELAHRWISRIGTTPEVRNTYGPTEATVTTTLSPLKPASHSGREVSIGKPLDSAEVYVLDPWGQLAPLGVPGELYVGGAGVARGYAGRSALTARSFVPHPYTDQPGARLYRTGDLVVWEPQGELRFLGRIDRQVKLRGYRLELGEVENALGQLPEVHSAAVILRNDQDRSYLAAYVQSKAPDFQQISTLRNQLKIHLPDYMIPTAFAFVDQMPLTPNGKLDRKALEKITQLDRASSNAQTTPRSAREQQLAAIWCDLLGLESVGVHDNFFEIGGDSILSIQVLARANATGMAISPKQFFENQTIASLAALQTVKTTTTKPMEGPFELLPIQHNFFQKDGAAHYHHCFVLVTPPRLSAEILQQACDALFAHHDLLRAHFHNTGQIPKGEVAPVGSAPFFHEDFSEIQPAERPTALLQLAQRHQRETRLEQGPMGFVIAIQKGGEDDGNRLLFALHHLVVDGVSWRILMEDLQTALTALLQGQPIQLPQRTTSYAQWSQRLQQHAQSPSVQKQAAFWLAQDPAPLLPTDSEGHNTYGEVESLSFQLNSAQTDALLREANRAYHTRPEELMLTAILQALKSWTHQHQITLELERHGREPLFPDLDTSRTVGWFTHTYPLTFELPQTNPGEILVAVKEKLRAVPNKGIGHGLLQIWGEPATRRALQVKAPAEIIFNYLGQLDINGSNGTLMISDEPTGPNHNPNSMRSHLLEIDVAVYQHQLKFTVRFARTIHKPTTIQAWLNQCQENLQDLINHCQTPGVGRKSPADYPLAPIDDASLQRLLNQCPQDVKLAALSPLQQGLLFHALYDQKDTYFEQVSVRLRGPLNKAAFQDAWKTVVARHEIMRTAFHWDGLPEPLQVIHSHIELPWISEDWCGETEINNRFKALEQADRKRGFVMESAGLLRCRLIQIESDQHYFLWSFHHLLLDGWSIPLVIDEVFHHYRALCSGTQYQPAPAKPFRNYIHWLQQQDPQACETYWRKTSDQLGEPTVLAQQKPGNDDTFAESTLHLPSGLTAQLEALAKANQTTLAQVVQAAWALLLGQYRGSQQVTFGLTVAGRPPEIDGITEMVGLFINTIPVPTHIGGHSLNQWLRDLHKQGLERERFAHASLLDIQKWCGKRRGSDLFESLLVFENYPVDVSLKRDPNQCQIEAVDGYETAHYPLTLVFLPGAQMRVRFKYRNPCFASEQIERLQSHLKATFQCMVANPQQAPQNIRLQDEPGRAELLRAWTDTARTYPDQSHLIAQFKIQVAQNPNATALEYEQEQVTYAQLDQRMEQLAAELWRKGLRPGTVAGVFTQRNTHMIVSLLAVVRLGATYLPLDASYPTARLHAMIADSGAQLLVTQQPQSLNLPEVDPQGSYPGTAPEIRVPTDQTAYMMYTSGSTGVPKGVCIPHRAILRLVCNSNFVKLTAQERTGQISNASFDAATYEIWGALLNGGTLVSVPATVVLSPTHLAEHLRKKRITNVFITAALFHQIAQTAPHSLASLTHLIVGGDAVNPAAVRTVLKHGAPKRILNGYGPTENTTFSTWHEVGPEDNDLRTFPIGKPIANTTALVLDAAGHITPAGIPGELVLGGDGLASGYHRRPALTASKFVPNPYGPAGSRLYRSGDKVRADKDGTIHFLGRLDHQVKIRGFRIEPGETRAVLASLPQVEEAWMAVREDTPDDRRLVAYIATTHPSPSLASDLRVQLKAQLPDYQIPSALVILDRLPLTPNGKVDTAALPKPEGSGWQAPYQPPTNDTEHTVAGMFAEILNIEKVGRDDDFFDLGGHSLTGTRLFSKLRNHFGIELPLATLFASPTVKAIATAIDAAKAVPQATSGPKLKKFARRRKSR